MWSARRSSAARRRSALVGVVETGRRADQDQALNGVGVGECGVERHTPAHRVADVRSGTADVDESIRAGPQIAVGWGRSIAVPRQVDGDGGGVGVDVGQF